jgi:hypothetical protein
MARGTNCERCWSCTPAAEGARWTREDDVVLKGVEKVRSTMVLVFVPVVCAHETQVCLVVCRVAACMRRCSMENAEEEVNYLLFAFRVLGHSDQMSPVSSPEGITFASPTDLRRFFDHGAAVSSRRANGRVKVCSTMPISTRSLRYCSTTTITSMNLSGGTASPGFRGER